VSLIAINQAQKNAIDDMPMGTARKMSGIRKLDMPAMKHER
jgi:hypothetical protein